METQAGAELTARCQGQGSPHLPLPTLLHMHCLGKLITLVGKDIPEEPRQVSHTTEGRITTSLGEQVHLPVKIKYFVSGSMENFFSYLLS